MDGAVACQGVILALLIMPTPTWERPAGDHDELGSLGAWELGKHRGQLGTYLQRRNFDHQQFVSIAAPAMVTGHSDWPW
jgi:hypothetical protein